MKQYHIYTSSTRRYIGTLSASDLAAAYDAASALRDSIAVLVGFAARAAADRAALDRSPTRRAAGLSIAVTLADAAASIRRCRLSCYPADLADVLADLTAARRRADLPADAPAAARRLARAGLRRAEDAAEIAIDGMAWNITRRHCKNIVKGQGTPRQWAVYTAAMAARPGNVDSAFADAARAAENARAVFRRAADAARAAAAANNARAVDAALDAAAAARAAAAAADADLSALKKHGGLLPSARAELRRSTYAGFNAADDVAGLQSEIKTALYNALELHSGTPALAVALLAADVGDAFAAANAYTNGRGITNSTTPILALDAADGMAAADAASYRAWQAADTADAAALDAARAARAARAAAIVKKAMPLLTPTQRRAARAYADAGCNAIAAARALGCRESTVRDVLAAAARRAARAADAVDIPPTARAAAAAAAARAAAAAADAARAANAAYARAARGGDMRALDAARAALADARRKARAAAKAARAAAAAAD